MKCIITDIVISVNRLMRTTSTLKCFLLNKISKFYFHFTIKQNDLCNMWRFFNLHFTSQAPSQSSFSERHEGI